MRKKLMEYLADENGATMIEYGFIAGGIGLTLLTGAFMFGEQMNDMIQTLSGYLDNTPLN